MSSIFGLVYWLLNLFLIALIGRLILDYIRIFSPNFRPRGIFLGIAELIYSVTDRPLSFVRQFVPPLRLGGISLDLSFTTTGQADEHHMKNVVGSECSKQKISTTPINPMQVPNGIVV